MKDRPAGAICSSTPTDGHAKGTAFARVVLLPLSNRLRSLRGRCNHLATSHYQPQNASDYTKGEKAGLRHITQNNLVKLDTIWLLLITTFLFRLGHSSLFVPSQSIKS